jgi:hypothetical protein
MDTPKRLLLNDIQEKHKRVVHFLDTHNLHAIWLTRRDNFAWYTGSADNRIMNTEPFPQLGLFITRNTTHLITEKTDPCWLTDDAVGEQNIELCVYDWYEQDTKNRLLSTLSGKLPVGTDTPAQGFKYIGDHFSLLRFPLTSSEQHQYRCLCNDCTAVLQSAAKSVIPGQTERQIAAQLAERCIMADITPSVLLISADSRVWCSPNWLSVSYPIERYAALTVVGHRNGLQVAVSRMIALEKLPPTIEAAYYAATRIEAVYVHCTLPGYTLGTILCAGIAAYRAEGFPNEWRMQPQGGVTGYAPTELLALPDGAQTVQPYYPIRWSPKIYGVGPEDTLLVLPDHNEILTSTDDWPMVEVEVNDLRCYCPDIMRL